MSDGSLRCWVYRSPRKQEMYLYLAREDDFDILPAPLLQGFGRPELVFELELDAQRRLAREDVTQVMHNLREQGFHLQMPPKLTPDLYHGNLD